MPSQSFHSAMGSIREYRQKSCCISDEASEPRTWDLNVVERQEVLRLIYQAHRRRVFGWSKSLINLQPSRQQDMKIMRMRYVRREVWREVDQSWS